MATLTATMDVSSLPAANKLAARLLTLADALQPKIDHASRPMTQNPTPKRNAQYQTRMHDARNMERTQKALRALADMHQAGTVPAELAGLKTAAAVAPLVRRYLDTSGGYYSRADSRDYADTSIVARLMQSFIEGNPAQRAEQERKRQLGEKQAAVALMTIAGYFPTPAPVVETMLRYARIESGNRVLEPEAGSGHIADAIRAAHPGVSLDVIEPVSYLREILELKGHNLVGSDVLDLSRSELGGYDRIVMNPPFERQQDIEHIQHVYNRLLAPGGILVSVLSPSFEFRSDRKSVAFRSWLENEVTAHWEPLPDGAFKASGTGVATRLVVIERR